MRIAYFDCFSGISGDMTVGALLSAGLPIDHLREELLKLDLPGYTINSRIIERSMITAVKFDVVVSSDNSHSHEHGHSHKHTHTHHHDHEHSDGHHHSPTSEVLEQHVHTHGLSFSDI